MFSEAPPLSNDLGRSEVTAAALRLAEAVRAVHRRYPTGVAVVTTTQAGVPYGLAVNAFSSVSLDPPSVLVCVNSSAQSHPHLYAGEHIGINFLAHDQAEIATVFARSGGEKFRDLSWHAGAHGVPILDRGCAHLEVRIDQRVTVSTHTIFIGQVRAATDGDRPPLVYLGGAFFDGSALRPMP